jgi:hypothetical protein
MNRHRRAIFIAAGHLGLSLGVAFLAFAFAWGAGLSDSYSGSANSTLGFFTVVLVLLQVPAALVDFAVIHLNSHHTSLSAQALVLLAVPSSLLYGYVITYLWPMPFSRRGALVDTSRHTRRRGSKAQG